MRRKTPRHGADHKVGEANRRNLGPPSVKSFSCLTGGSGSHFRRSSPPGWMRRIFSIASIASGAVLLLVVFDRISIARPAGRETRPEPPFSSECSFDDLYPRQLVAYRAASPPVIDGDLREPVWEDVGSSEPFVDIRGTPPGAPPRFSTTVKVRWDAHFLYIGAELQEPDVWANLTAHDSVIFRDNDFEVFVDAAGSASYYKEFEVRPATTPGGSWQGCRHVRAMPAYRAGSNASPFPHLRPLAPAHSSLRAAGERARHDMGPLPGPSVPQRRIREQQPRLRARGVRHAAGARRHLGLDRRGVS